jgi:hypothetical protein
MADQAKQIAALQAALGRLSQNPTQLRVVLALVLAGAWWGAVYRPLSERIASTQARLDNERQRLYLAETIEGLRAETQRFQERLPPRPDPNEAIQYLLDGVKALPVRLVSLTPAAGREMGPYKLVVVKLSAEGTYANLDRLLRWIETDRRLFRVEEIHLGPVEQKTSSGGGAGAVGEPQYGLNLTILGVTG